MSAGSSSLGLEHSDKNALRILECGVYEAELENEVDNRVMRDEQGRPKRRMLMQASGGEAGWCGRRVEVWRLLKATEGKELRSSDKRKVKKGPALGGEHRKLPAGEASLGGRGLQVADRGRRVASRGSKMGKTEGGRFKE